MEQSLFLQFVQRFFPAIVLGIVEKLNDTKNPLTYLYKRMLRKDFAVTGKWESINAANTLVMADVVAMDSSIPLKKRDVISKANGDIPKMGLELKLNERQLTELDTLQAQNGTQEQLLTKLFADTSKAIGGVYERLEALFLEALSTGVMLIDDIENVGTGFRVDFGYLTANKFGTAVIWSNTSATPLADIQRVLDKAALDGNTITRVMLDLAAFNNLVKTTEVKNVFAFSQGFVGTNIPAPSLSQINQVTSDRYGFVFEIVNRSVRYEKNGVQTSVKPWATGAVVFLTSDQVGSLVYARLAEQNHPVANVTYETADDFILVSKYRMNKPSLSEYTNSQARVLPVLMNVDQIYLLDSTAVQA